MLETVTTEWPCDALCICVLVDQYSVVDVEEATGDASFPTLGLYETQQTHQNSGQRQQPAAV